MIIIVSRQTPSDYSTTVQKKSEKSYMENRKVPADVILVSMDVPSLIQIYLKRREYTRYSEHTKHST